MLNKKVHAALIDQMQMEFIASYAYLGMATYCKMNALQGFGAFFDRQSTEERAHAMKIYNYLLETDADITLKEIAAPSVSYKSILDVFQSSLVQEKAVTKSLNNIYNLARDEKDNATVILLQWFINEQIEEEAGMRDAIEQLTLAGDNTMALMMLDREYAAKVPGEEG